MNGCIRCICPKRGENRSVNVIQRDGMRHNLHCLWERTDYEPGERKSKVIGILKLSLTSCASSVVPMPSDKLKVVFGDYLNEYPTSSWPISNSLPSRRTSLILELKTCLCEYPRL